MEVSMKSYLVDVPVLLFVYIRPNTLQSVFEVIKEARPSKLFLVSDGPRPGKPDDMEKIVRSRKIVEEIDWDCKVYQFYSDENHGLYNMIREALDWVFYFEDRCIYLEDDVVPSLCFFQYCAELLERYKDDLRVNMICGMNHLGEYKEPNTDYFFSEAASIWGFALWRRTYKAFYDYTYGEDNYILDRIKDNAQGYKEFSKALEGYYRNAFYGGHIAGPEFYLRYVICSQNKVNIIPKYNMINNIGFGEGATHAAEDLRIMPKGVQNMFQMKTYEYTFPLKHPSYLVADKKYEKKILRIVGRNDPLIMFYRRCEGLLRRIYFDRDIIFIKGRSNRYGIMAGIITVLMILCGFLIFILKREFRKLMRSKKII
jgi:hypothetical protein